MTMMQKQAISSTACRWPLAFVALLLLLSGGAAWGAAAANPFKWYYHNSTKNETQAALKAAVENQCGLLVYVGNPGCSVCAGIWNNTATSKLTSFLKNRKIVALKIEDSTSHYQSLATKAKLYRNPDGSKVAEGPPFLVFIKVKDSSVDTTSIDFAKSTGDIDTYFCGSTGKYLPTINATNVIDWLTELMDDAAYQAACPGPGATPTPGDDDDSGDDDSGDDDTPSAPVVVDRAAFKWYYHNSSKNETQAALKAAVENRCGLLVYVGNPGCSVCAGIWNNTATSVLASFLKEEMIVALKVEDSTSHYQSLATKAKLYKNPDGSKVAEGPPFLVFIKVKDSSVDTTSIDFAKSTGDIDTYFCGSTGKYLPTINAANVITWLTSLMDTSYYEVCPGPETSREPALAGTLKFFAEDPSYLGTTTLAGVECYDTAGAVARAATSLSGTVSERYFKFHGVPGNRYVFSVTAAAGGPSLAELVAKSMELTCAVHSIEEDLGPSADPVDSVFDTTHGFAALDRGFYFVPETEADYYLRISSSSKLTAEIPFTLRYHYASLGDEGSMGLPKWSGATPGAWSMDYDAAVDWSIANGGKPFLVYFTALGWCPHCASFEHLVAETAGFKNATKALPMVAIDNRRRGEVTGPTLLYSPDYQELYGLTSATVEAKLAANQSLQKELLALGDTRIGYPTFLLCRATQGTNGNGVEVKTVQVIARTDDTYYYPVGTDFSAFGKRFVEKLTALAEDGHEEFDNYAQNAAQAKVFEIKASDVASAELRAGESVAEEAVALLGGYDVADWRALEFDSKVDCILRVSTGEFDEGTAVTLGIYDTLGAGTNEGNLLQSVTAVAPELPSLELRAKGPSSYRVKVSAVGQETPVDYTLAAQAALLPPYDIALEAPSYQVRQCDGGSVTVSASWERLSESDELASVELVLDGPGSCAAPVQQFGGAAGGTLNWTITGLSASSETKVTLVPTNCRVKGNSPATIHTYGAPAFVGRSEGETMAVKLIQSMELGNIAIPLVNGLDATTTVKVLSGTLPTGLTLGVAAGSQAGFADLVIQGRANTATTSAQRVTVQLGAADGTAGATLVLSFTVQPLADVNPFAANVENFTGYIVSSEDGTVFGTFTMAKKSSGFAVEAAFIDVSVTVSGTASSWTALSDGTVYTEAELEGEKLVLMLGTDGTGFGWFEDDELAECYLAFRPDMSSDVASPEFAGAYNVSLESGSTAYRGYGWLTVEVDADGEVTYAGVLPDGGGITQGTTHLVEENGYGVFTVVSFDGTDFVSGRVQITPASQHEDGVPCVSACSSSLALFWYDALYDETSRLTPCGAKYDRSAATFLEQTVNHDGTHFENLAFYAITVPFAEEPPESYPAGICAQLLPTCIELEEDAGTFVVKDYSDATVAPYSQQEIAISFDAKGLMNGSFRVFDAGTGVASAMAFSGILTPIPASCCSAGPEAVGYGTVLSDDGAASWPVRIVPDRVEVPKLAAPTVGTPTSETVTATGKPDSPLYTYALLDGKGTITGFAEDGVFAWGDLGSPESCSVAVVANGFVGEGTPLLSVAAGGFDFEVTLDETDASSENITGWRAYAMPKDRKLLSEVATEQTVLAYQSGAAFQVKTWNELKPGQAFWVYLNGAAVEDGKVTLVTAADAKVVAVEPTSVQSVAGWNFQEAPETPTEKFWKWSGTDFQKGSDGVGWLFAPAVAE